MLPLRTFWLLPRRVCVFPLCACAFPLRACTFPLCACTFPLCAPTFSKSVCTGPLRRYSRASAPARSPGSDLECFRVLCPPDFPVPGRCSCATRPRFLPYLPVRPSTRFGTFPPVRRGQRFVSPGPGGFHLFQAVKKHRDPDGITALFAGRRSQLEYFRFLIPVFPNREPGAGACGLKERSGGVSALLLFKKNRSKRCNACSDVAEKEGFEPSKPLRVYMISNHAPSTN